MEVQMFANILFWAEKVNHNTCTTGEVLVTLNAVTPDKLFAIAEPHLFLPRQIQASDYIGLD